jgi:uncharacterized protein with HEPN domain
MRDDPRKLLYDVAAASDAVLKFCRDREVQDYVTDDMLRSACERQFEIMGEAAVRLRETHPEVFEQIPDGRAIIGLRNRLAHGYDSVDSEIVWNVIRNRVPDLAESVKSILQQLG